MRMKLVLNEKKNTWKETERKKIYVWCGHALAIFPEMEAEFWNRIFHSAFSFEATSPSGVQLIDFLWRKWMILMLCTTLRRLRKIRPVNLEYTDSSKSIPRNRFPHQFGNFSAVSFIPSTIPQPPYHIVLLLTLSDDNWPCPSWLATK